MAPLPYNNTAIYKLYYTVAGHQHSHQVRAVAPFSPSDFGALEGFIFDAMDPILFPVTIDFATFQASGSNVSNPVITGIEGNTYGSGSPGPQNVPIYADWVGRSTGGRRVRYAIFGLKTVDDNFRFSAGQSTEIDAVQALIEAETLSFLAVDGLTTIWKSYANNGYNAYWQRAVR